MNRSLLALIICVPMLGFFAGCVSPDSQDMAALETQIAANIFATQTASVPMPTETPLPIDSPAPTLAPESTNTPLPATPTSTLVRPTATATLTAKPDVTAEDVISAFKAAGLEAESPRKMSREDYGAAPLVCDGTRFLIPSLGENRGGRIFICDDDSDRQLLVNYYESLSKTSALFFSWLFVKDEILVQIGGDLEEDLAKHYEQALP